MNIKIIASLITGVFVGAIGTYVYLDKKKERIFLNGVDCLDDYSEETITKKENEELEGECSSKAFFEAATELVEIKDEEETVVKNDEEIKLLDIEIIDTFGDIEDGDDWTTDVVFFDKDGNVLDSNYEKLTDYQIDDILGFGTLPYMITRATYSSDENVFYLRNHKLQLSIELYYYDSLKDEGMFE